MKSTALFLGLMLLSCSTPAPAPTPTPRIHLDGVVEFEHPRLVTLLGDGTIRIELSDGAVVILHAGQENDQPGEDPAEAF